MRSATRGYDLAAEFYSPGKGGEPSQHRQPDVTVSVMEKLKELPRRTKTGDEGFDALGTAVLECRNDGHSPVRVEERPPAPPSGDIFHYESMIRRIAHLYEARFPRP
jgi:hypothetical protein